METLCVLAALRKNPALRAMFAGGPPAPLTHTVVRDLFRFSYSVRGSSRRMEEESTIAYWLDWLQDVESMQTVIKINWKVKSPMQTLE